MAHKDCNSTNIEKIVEEITINSDEDIIGSERSLEKYKDVTVTDLKDLRVQLYHAFESEPVNMEYIRALLTAYKSNPEDWKKYAKFDLHRYTRNLVDEGNDKFNLMILCWGEGHGSAIHDHSDSDCFMKVLQGELEETRFYWPEKDEVNEETANTEMKELSRTTFKENGVYFINDGQGLHRVENPSHVDVAVTMHLYFPPYDTCSVFNQQTSLRQQIKSAFWSVYGHKIVPEAKREPEDN